MYCKNCGNKLPETAVFCGKCGVKLENTVSDVNKKSAFTKKRMIMITAVGCILIVAIIMVVLLWEKPSQDIDVVAENTTESMQKHFMNTNYWKVFLIQINTAYDKNVRS